MQEPGQNAANYIAQLAEEVYTLRSILLSSTSRKPCLHNTVGQVFLGLPKVQLQKFLVRRNSKHLTGL